MPRPARRYSKRIEVYSYIANPDGFGGNTISATKAGDAWAEIRTIPTDKLGDFGLDIDQQSLLVYVRKRSDINYDDDNIYISYKGIDYTVVRATESDLNGVEFQLLVSGR